MLREMTPIPDWQSKARSRSEVKPSIFLVGFMGAGKTSVGQALSRRLHWPFEDLDDRIEEQSGRSIEEIFRVLGEAAFREMEHAALRNLCEELRQSARVVALGGGAFVQPANLALIKGLAAHTVFLDAPVDELLHRCQQQQKNRPLCRDASQFRQLYEARQPGYLSAACRIDTQNKDIELVAAEVACSLGIE
jgi:shikimate kinase